MMRLIRSLVTLVVLVGVLAAPEMARAQSSSEHNPWKPWESSAPDLGRPFEPPYSPRLYAAPSAPNKTTEVPWDPPPGVSCGANPLAGQKCVVAVETWLPQDREGVDPRTGEAYPSTVDEKWPVIFTATVYAKGGGGLSSEETALVERGYAISVIHLPGSGKSPGCVDRHGIADAAATSAGVEYLAGKREDSSGKRATDDWSDGKIGGRGKSYGGGAVVNVAARGTEKARGSILALVVIAPHISDYEAQWTFDGVRSTGIQPAVTATYMAPYPVGYEATQPKTDFSRDYKCYEALLADNVTNPQANVTPYYQERDIRLLAGSLQVPVLATHGHADLVPNGGNPPMVQAGFFDQLPGGTQCGADACKRGLFGVWGHSNPAGNAAAPRWNRNDWNMTVVRWFDRWVKGERDTRVEEWPVVQVQGTDGQWRAEPNWPTTGGPVGQLALGAAKEIGGTGSLGGDSEPSGDSFYIEGVGNDVELKRFQQLVFETPPLDGRLQITGQPVADLWVKLDKPDAHIAARLEILDRDGNPIRAYASKGLSTGWTYGLRSVRHLAPLEENVFVQAEDVPAPFVSIDGASGNPPDIFRPIRVPVRFQPTDLVVPAGGRLRLTISGSTMVNPGLQQLQPQTGRGEDDPLLGFSEPSGSATRVTVLHQCTPAPTESGYEGAPMVSTLRFLMPSSTPDLLNVRETDEGDPDPLNEEHKPLVANPVEGPISSDGGGVATASVCGQQPSRITDVISSLGGAETTLRFTSSSATSGAYSDDVTIEAELTSLDSAVDGASITLSLAGEEKVVTTDNAGLARASFTLTSPPGDYSVAATFNGNDELFASETSAPFAVTKEDSHLELTVEGEDDEMRVIARLSDLDSPSAGISGAMIDFYSDSQLIGSSQTDNEGVATFEVPPQHRGANRTYNVFFAGDDFYLASSGSRPGKGGQGENGIGRERQTGRGHGGGMLLMWVTSWANALVTASCAMYRFAP